MTKQSIISRGLSTGLVILIAVLGVFAATVSATTATAGEPRLSLGSGRLPGKQVGASELRQAKNTPVAEILRKSTPLRPLRATSRGRVQRQGPDGPERTFRGARPALASAASATSSHAAASQNGAWPGSFSSNPNAQIGKLIFWTGKRWSHCTATAINSENKSVVLTAGHCVYNHDPDDNERLDGNSRWNTHIQFCPGYESGCKLGVWYARNVYTTHSWFNTTATNYNWSDDVAVVLVSPHPTKGHLVNAVGGHGISFNLSTGRQRHAFGYPANDHRFPGYTYSGEDMMYCPGVDSYDGRGHVLLACTMTGGASGGPWIINPNSSWLGIVNSVNSHKPSGTVMGGAYFGQAESDLFQYTRAR